MAALETSGHMLETSCGSPHYASPEIVAGKNYHGAPSDIWSCGIILFALLTGHLPFDDENIRKLLLKVQTGKYIMPSDLSSDAKDLISRMLQVDPANRISMKGILRHKLLRKYPISRRQATIYQGFHRSAHVADVTHPINSRDDVDYEILRNLQILWRGESEEKILSKLMSSELNSEKTFYCLLMKYRHDHTPLMERKRSSHQHHGSNSSSIAVPLNYHHRKRSSQTLSKKVTVVKTHSRNGSRSSVIVSASSSNKRNVAFAKRKQRTDRSANDTETDDFNFEDVANNAFKDYSQSTPKSEQRVSVEVPQSDKPIYNEQVGLPSKIPISSQISPSQQSSIIAAPIVNSNGNNNSRSVSDPTHSGYQSSQVQKRVVSAGDRPSTLDPASRPYSAYSTTSTESKDSDISETYLLPMIFEEDRFADAIEEEIQTKVYNKPIVRKQHGMGRLQRPPESLFTPNDVFSDTSSTNLYKSLKIPQKPETSRLQISGMMKSDSFKNTTKPSHTGFAAYRTPSSEEPNEHSRVITSTVSKPASTVTTKMPRPAPTTTKTPTPNSSTTSAAAAAAAAAASLRQKNRTDNTIKSSSALPSKAATTNSKSTRIPLVAKDVNQELNIQTKSETSQKPSRGASLLRKLTLNPKRPPPPPPSSVEIIENNLKPQKSETTEGIKQNWFMKMISGTSNSNTFNSTSGKRQTSQTSTLSGASSSSSRGSSKILFSNMGVTTVRHIVVEVLEEWRKYGISDITENKSQSTVKAVISSGNVLRMRSAKFQVQVHAISGGTSITFTQDRGSSSTFQRFLTEFERALGEMAVLSAPKLKGAQAHVLAVF